MQASTKASRDRHAAAVKEATDDNERFQSALDGGSSAGHAVRAQGMLLYGALLAMAAALWCPPSRALAH